MKFDTLIGRRDTMLCSRGPDRWAPRWVRKRFISLADSIGAQAWNSVLNLDDERDLRWLSLSRVMFREVLGTLLAQSIRSLIVFGLVGLTYN